LARFPDVVRQRGLDVDVLAALHGLGRDHRVGMVRGGYDHGVDALLLVEHLAEVLVLGRVGVTLHRGSGQAAIDVAEGHDVGAFAFLHIAQASGAQPHAGDVQPFTGWPFLRLGTLTRLRPEHGAGKDKAARRHGAMTQKTTPG